jgi:hypothetical protein
MLAIILLGTYRSERYSKTPERTAVRSTALHQRFARTTAASRRRGIPAGAQFVAVIDDVRLAGIKRQV